MARTNKYTQRRKGIVTPYGQWKYPGQVTTIPDNMITMRGVPYPVLGVSDKGDTKMMLPGMDYLFKGNEVTEYPVMQQGGFGRKRVEKNGMEYLSNTDGYTGVVQKQTQHGLGLSRRYDAPVYQYYDNGNPLGESWKGASGFQNDIVKDYESEPVVPFRRKYSNYDPNSLTYFKDLATGETPFKPYISPERQALWAYQLPITENPSQTRMGYSVPRYIPSVNTTHYIEDTNGIVNGWYNDNRENAKIEDYIDELRPWMEKYEGRRNNAYKLDGENWYTIGIGHAHVPQGTMWNDDKINETFKNDILSRANAIDRYYKEKGVTLSPRTLAGLAAYSFSGYGSNVMQRSPKLTGHIVNNRFDNIREEMDWGERQHPRLKDKHDELYKWLTEGYFQTGGKIHIKEKNRGKFTEAAQRAGKSVQAYAAQILANKDNYSPTLVKRANFARNSAKFKHQEGGTYLDTFFSNADKQNNMYDRNAMTQLDNYFTERGLTENQKKALLYNILIESGGAKTLGAHGNGYYGLVGWDSNRYGKIKDKSLIGQAAYLVDSLKNDNGEYSWNHGGDGSGYNSWIDARNAFWNPDADFDTVNNALIYGYIRPANKIGRKNNAAKFYQTGGIGKYAKGGTPPHWDPEHPHFHMDEEGNIFPADYAGEDNAWTIGENIPNVTPQQIVDAIAAHQSAMNDDRYKYIDNPEYKKLLPTLQIAKRIYDWGNKKMDIYPYSSNWEWNHPNMPLKFNENGVGYLNGQTYLPVNRPLKDGENAYSIAGPSDISNSQYYEYVTTDIPSEKIVRTKFTEIPVISNETQITAKQKAVDKYISDNTKKLYDNYLAAYDTEFDWNGNPITNGGISYMFPDPIRNTYYIKNFDSQGLSWPILLKTMDDFGLPRKYTEEQLKKALGLAIKADNIQPRIKRKEERNYENIKRANEFLDSIGQGKTDNEIRKLSAENAKHSFYDFDFNHYINAHPGTLLRPSQEEAERNAQIDLKDLLSKHQIGGIGKYLEGNYIQPQTIGNVMGAWNDMLAKGLSKGDNIANLVGTGLQATATAGGAVATQFGKNFTKDIMAGQRNKQTSAIASNFEVQENPNAAPLYWPSEQNNNIQPLNNGYYGFPVIDNGESPYKSNQRVNIRKNSSSGDYWNNYFNQNNEFDRMDYLKFATGGSSSTPAEIERGEVVSTPTGDSIANGLMDYHELYDNQNEKKKNIVNLTNNMVKDVVRNPQLTPVSNRVNRYTSMRRNGNTFIFPSTVGLNGKILEPKNGMNYPLAKLINRK